MSNPEFRPEGVRPGSVNDDTGAPLYTEFRLDHEPSEKERVELFWINKKVEREAVVLRDRSLKKFLSDETIRDNISPKMREYILSNFEALLTPKYTVLNGKNADVFRQKVFDDVCRDFIDKNEEDLTDAELYILHEAKSNLLDFSGEHHYTVLFQLPKIASRWWWKIDNHRKTQHALEQNSPKSKDTRGLFGVVEWGIFYDEFMKIYHKLEDLRDDEYPMSWGMISTIGHRRADEWYYIFDVFDFGTQPSYESI